MSSEATRPIVAITMGDPAGIGPEVIVKALAQPEIYAECRPLVVGDAGCLARESQRLGLPLTVRPVRAVAEALFQPGIVDVYQATDLDLSQILPGRVDARAGAAAVQAVQVATRLALAGAVQAICTAPLNKEAMHLAGYPYPGHTEMLGALTGAREYTMLLVADRLRVVHVSTHVSLRQAIERVKKDRVLRTIRLAHQAATEYLGIAEPHIGVAGLNPHAGESRLFGDEDADEIAPAVAAAQAEGLRVSGPWPGDTLFPRAARGEFDIVVAMYHDQGHIPVKMLGFDRGVNVTIGLPIIRTSVDHGTAFDIAGQGRASPTSLIEAIRMAAQIARRRLSGAVPGAR